MSLPPMPVTVPSVTVASRIATTPPPIAVPPASVPVQRVEWSGAVRPPDAAARSMRLEGQARADVDLPTGPPPAFSANVLDKLPDALTAPQEGVADETEGAGDEAARASPGAPAPGAGGMAGPRDADGKLDAAAPPTSSEIASMRVEASAGYAAEPEVLARRMDIVM